MFDCVEFVKFSGSFSALLSATPRRFLRASSGGVVAVVTVVAVVVQLMMLLTGSSSSLSSDGDGDGSQRASKPVACGDERCCGGAHVAMRRGG